MSLETIPVPVREVDGIEVPAEEKYKQVDTRQYEDFDMVIVGAGISGINMGYRFQQHFPKKSYIILEQRENLGGTWDLMRYPGIRSDSDLHSFGFAWRPWEEEEPIAEGYKILRYMEESAKMYGIYDKIKFQHTVRRLDWSSREQSWTLTVNAAKGDSEPEKTKYFRATQFLVMGTGYYDYDTPLKANVPGLDSFKGQTVHPQFWPENLDYADKSIAVIGSGATAVTLIPALAKKAKKVTMIQRSPTYIVALKNSNRHKPWWITILPKSWQHYVTRIRFIIGGFYIQRFFAMGPEVVKGYLAKITKQQLPKHIAFDPHFKPRYDPWDQRLCVAPDGDFFQALHRGNTDVCTGVIKTVSEDRVVMEDGSEIEADIIVTATGLRMKYGGNADIYVDGELLDWGQKFFWRGVMISDVPNMSQVMGYTKASWTLGADATASMVIRMIKHMERHGYTSATPRVDKKELPRLTQTNPGIMGLTSTYIMTALHRLPKTSDVDPWRSRGNWMKDMVAARFADLNKGMQFTLAAG